MIFIRKITKRDKPVGIEVIENIDNINFETITFPRGLLNFCLTGLLCIIPGAVSGLLIKKSNSNAKIVHENVATHTALDTLYSNGLRLRASNRNFISAIIEHAWFNLNNPKSVRNRLRLIKKLLFDEISKKIKNKQTDIVVISLASGSARAVIETLVQFPQLEYQAILVDRSDKALAASRRIAEINNLDLSCCTFNQDNVRNFETYADKKADIIEMVGLLDYLDKEKANKIFQKIYGCLKPGGIFITANIRQNQERKFLEKCLNWNMIYREPADLGEELVKAGFPRQNVKLFYEPLKIHGVAIAEK